MKRRMPVGVLAALVATSAAVSAQQRPAPTPPQAPPPQVVVPLYQAPADANATRDQLQDLLRQFPPSVGQVLRYDPSLLTRADYLAPYPQLVAFLQQHPEIARNAGFYFGGYDYEFRRREPLPPEIEALGVLLGGMAAFLGVSAFIGVLTWLVRAVIQHRRWLRLSKVQAEVHTKLMDRLTTNDELLAYIQSPAGRRFLESAPIQSESDTPRQGAPVGPIIWSMMAGIVFATVGAGFRLAAQSVTDEAQQAFTVVGVIILALGAGFILSAIMAYLVSARLGLFPSRPATDSSSGNA
ncbi:MAG: hypothetical protein ACRD2N_17720 [Vicinamibacterales bacterium]